MYYNVQMIDYTVEPKKYIFIIITKLSFVNFTIRYNIKPGMYKK